MPLIAGVDEVGRGCICGDVVAAAVILADNANLAELKDSKKLTEKRREQLAVQIQSQALAYSIATVDAKTIDRVNILQASMLAMKKAIENLSVSPDRAYIDGPHVPKGLSCQSIALIKGDNLHASISAASILAKVYRDRQMLELHQQYPQYGFDRHKGYPTPFHKQKLLEHGVLDCYRRSYQPVQLILSKDVQDTKNKQ